MDDEYLELLIEDTRDIKNINKTIDEIKQELKDNRKLIESINIMALEMKNMRVDVGKIDNRLCKVENKPVERYEDIKKTIINTAVSVSFGTVIGALISLIII